MPAAYRLRQKVLLLKTLTAFIGDLWNHELITVWCLSNAKIWAVFDLKKTLVASVTNNGHLCNTWILLFPSTTATRYPGGRWCRPEQFECSNHLCVNPHWVCDGNDDCGDASDEQLSLCCEKYFFIYCSLKHLYNSILIWGDRQHLGDFHV